MRPNPGPPPEGMAPRWLALALLLAAAGVYSAVLLAWLRELALVMTEGR